MKKFTILMVFVALFFVTTVVVADQGGIPATPDLPGTYIPLNPGGRAIGERLFLTYGSPVDMPKNEPFHVAHGWRWSLPKPPAQVTNDRSGMIFTLELDGILLERDFIYIRVTPAVQNEFGVFNRQTLWVFNFPDGLEGSHEFVSKWLVKCQVLVDNGAIPGPCADPDEFILWGSTTVTVNFE